MPTFGAHIEIVTATLNGFEGEIPVPSRTG